METIDFFKYKCLLAELESIKGTISPINSFIKKLLVITDNLSTLPENRESTRYAFMLITRAISYSTAARKATKSVQQRLNDIAKLLCNYEVVTADNALETFEFWNSSIRFVPSNLTDLHKIEAILQVLTPRHSNIALYASNIQELMAFSGKMALLTKLYILATIGPESLILKYLSSGTFNAESVISNLESTITNLQIILKEAHEQHSLGSTTV